MVTKEALLARAQTGRYKTVKVDDLDLRVRRLSLAERIEIGDRARGGEKIPPTEYLARCLVQEDDSPMFSVDEAQAFCDGDGEFAERVVNAVLVATGLAPAENAAKN